MEIVFCLKKQKLKRIGFDEVAGFARNHIYATFNFDKDWIDLEKYAIFSSPNGKKYIQELGYGEELTCIVPEEVLTGAYFKVSIFGNDLLTSTQETILLSASGYVSDIDNMDYDDVITTSTNTYTKVYRKKHYDEDVDIRLNKFEVLEHPYQ